MELEGLSGLPSWVQAVVAVSMFVGVAVTAIKGYTSKTFAAKTEDQRQHDGIVVSATMADKSAIDRLVVALNENSRLQGEMLHRMDSENDGRTILVTSTNDLKHSIDRLVLETVRGK